ncbi:MAG TPA: PadR family transcriptional regulator [Vicinamibacterales bacterium]|nr:PadR family transcriptional regulator [Vicinamibacterales bacterium]
MTRSIRDARGLLPLPAHDLHILLAVLDVPRHGYAVIRHVEGTSGGQLHLGTSTVYAALKRMLGAGLIEETNRPGNEASEDVRRRYYQATPFGREVAREAAKDVERLHTAVRRLRLLRDTPLPRRGRP